MNKPTHNKTITFLNQHLPLVIVTMTVILLTVTNIKPGTYFSGWDNFHPEFNLSLAVKRALFGAWATFQGTGAPASQSQIAEITRLPIIFALTLLLPQNLIRYIFHFLMVFIGGISMYFYIKNIWLSKIDSTYKNWVASLGGIFYIFNITTLQQFYISFEPFAVEFAFLPLVFLSIHWLAEEPNKKAILLFIIIQLLIASYAFVPTVCYFAFIFYVIYGFFVYLQAQKNIFSALKKTVLLVFLILFINSYWLLPNIYYAVHNAYYVQQSRANQLFDLEALWSVREAGTIDNFITGLHFIFNWKHFNFKTFQHEYNFQAWGKHLSRGLTIFLLVIFTLASHLAFIKLFFDRQKGYKRWCFIIIFLFTTIGIWIGLFLPDKIFNFIYSFGILQNSIRNLYTKLSTIYSFLLTIAFCLSIESLLIAFKKNIYSILLIIVSFSAIFYASLPSFTGNFIDQELKITYPQEYFEMFAYLQTKPNYYRVLELPYMSHDGWILYDWTKQSKPDGYQGMGFFYFGIPQALITPDFARWTETTDFFYHELKYALNSQNPTQLHYLLEKYNINLVIIDETVVRNFMPNYNYQKDHQLLKDIDYKVAWRKNFLTVYEKNNILNKEGMIIPKKIGHINADTARIRRDYVYEQNGGYISKDQSSAEVIYPFINLTKSYIKDAIISQDYAYIKRTIPENYYTLTVPGYKESVYSTVAQILFDGQSLRITLPKNSITIDNQNIELFKINDIHVKLNSNFDSIILYYNNQYFQLHRQTAIYPVLNLNLFQPIELSYFGLQNKYDVVFVSDRFPINIIQPDWDKLINDTIISKKIKEIKISTIFPAVVADLNKFPTDNCNQPKFGLTPTKYENHKVIYQADEYGVNCSYYNFDYFTPNTSYLLQLSGKNVQGRSIKLFINYNSQNSTPEEFLMPKGEYRTTMSLLPVNTKTELSMALNWETRSNGKLDQNELYELKYIPFPLDRFSQIHLEKNDYQPAINDIKLTKIGSFFNFLYSIDINCYSPTCFVGIDQAYDDLWIAFGKNLQILPHFRYNNWANIWQVNKSKKILVVYIPEIISLISLFLLISVCSILTVNIVIYKDDRSKTVEF